MFRISRVVALTLISTLALPPGAYAAEVAPAEEQRLRLPKPKRPPPQRKKETGPSPAQLREAERHRAEGMRLFRGQEFAAAADAFSAALKITPKDARLYAARGYSWAHAGQEHRAYDDFYYATTLDGDLFEAHVGMAELKKAQISKGVRRGDAVGPYQTADVSYRNAIRLRPNEPQLHYGLGTANYAYYMDRGTGFLGNKRYARAVQEWQSPQVDWTDIAAALIGVVILGTLLSDAQGGSRAGGTNWDDHWRDHHYRWQMEHHRIMMDALTSIQ